MRHEILYQPSYAVAKVTLDQGEAIRAESGAMVGMSPTVQIDSKMQGGLGKALGRLLGGESLFQTTFTATHGPGEVLLAPAGPGDIFNTEPGYGLVVTNGCFLAGDTTLNFETVASFKGFFSGEGLFMMKVSGAGQMLLSSFGAIHAIQLQAGQPYVVDTGHIVAFTAGMGYELRKAAGGILNTLKSGEGIVVNLTGPGVVYLQTRTPASFGSFISRYIPSGS